MRPRPRHALGGRAAPNGAFTHNDLGIEGGKSFGDALAVFRAAQLSLLMAVADEADLGKDGGHRSADQHDERRAFHSAVVLAAGGGPGALVGGRNGLVLTLSGGHLALARPADHFAQQSEATGPVIGLALFLIPVHVIPGNTIAIQSRLYQLNDYLLLACIASLESLLIAMSVYIVRHRQHRTDRIGPSGRGNIGLLSGIPAFLFGAKACPMLMVALFGGFGSGAVVSALHHHQGFFVVSLLALIAGGELYGITGALLASPVAGVLQAVVIAIWSEWREMHPKDFQAMKDDIADKMEKYH